MLTGSILDDFTIGRDPFFELSHHVYQLRQQCTSWRSSCHKTVTFMSLSASRPVLIPLLRMISAQMSDNDIDFSILIEPQVPTRTFKAGETIFRADDPATELYVIQEGRVGIQAGNRLLDTLEGKTIFGEMALVDGAPSSATAVAMTDVTLVPVLEKQFLFLVSQTPFFALKVMRVLARRLRASNKVI